MTKSSEKINNNRNTSPDYSNKNYEIIDYNKFDPGKITYDNPVKLSNNIFIAPNSNDYPLLFKIPKMRLFSDSISLNRNNDSLELDLQFSVNDKNFYDFIVNIDSENIEIIYENSMEWFRNDFSRNVILDFYKSSIFNSDQGDIEIPYFKVGIDIDSDNNPLCVINGVNKLSEIRKDSEISGILQLKGLTFLKKHLITDWKLIEINVINDKINLTKFLINNQIPQGNDYNKNVIDDEIVKQLAGGSISDALEPKLDSVSKLSDKSSDNQSSNNQSSNNQIETIPDNPDYPTVSEVKDGDRSVPLNLEDSVSNKDSSEESIKEVDNLIFGNESTLR